MKPKWPAGLLCGGLLLAAGGCHQFENPFDPDSPNYRTAPDAPENLRKTGGGAGYIELAWDAVEHADFYEIEQAPDPGDYADRDWTADTTCRYDSVLAGPYRYHVRAWNQGGSSPWSAELAETVP